MIADIYTKSLSKRIYLFTCKIITAKYQIHLKFSGFMCHTNMHTISWGFGNIPNHFFPVGMRLYKSSHSTICFDSGSSHANISFHQVCLIYFEQALTVLAMVMKTVYYSMNLWQSSLLLNYQHCYVLLA